MQQKYCAKLPTQQPISTVTTKLTVMCCSGQHRTAAGWAGGPHRRRVRELHHADGRHHDDRPGHAGAAAGGSWRAAAVQGHRCHPWLQQRGPAEHRYVVVYQGIATNPQTMLQCAARTRYGNAVYACTLDDQQLPLAARTCLLSSIGGQTSHCLLCCVQWREAVGCWCSSHGCCWSKQLLELGVGKNAFNHKIIYFLFRTVNDFMI